jgi:hypothetical protein
MHMTIDWPPNRLPGRASGFVLIAAVVSLATGAVASHCEIVDENGAVSVKMEAESYWSAFDTGGKPMSIATCDPDASGGESLEGLDYSGDWVMLRATVTDPIVFRLAMRSAEDHNIRARFIVEFAPMGGVGPVAARDTLNPPMGKGIG